MFAMVLPKSLFVVFFVRDAFLPKYIFFIEIYRQMLDVYHFIRDNSVVAFLYKMFLLNQ